MFTLVEVPSHILRTEYSIAWPPQNIRGGTVVGTVDARSDHARKERTEQDLECLFPAQAVQRITELDHVLS